jgi:hypothetical protein
MADLNELRANLVRSPAARARFVSDLFTLLEKQGIDVDDPAIVRELDLNLDLSDGEKFAGGALATTNIITIVA